MSLTEGHVKTSIVSGWQANFFQPTRELPRWRRCQCFGITAVMKISYETVSTSRIFAGWSQ